MPFVSLLHDTAFTALPPSVRPSSNILFSYKERNNEFSYANLRRQHRVPGGGAGAGGGGKFLFSRRLYDVNKGEESSLCDLLLDSERDSGAGTSLCGSSTGGSSSQRRRASAPFGIHHHQHHNHPATQHWHPTYHYHHHGINPPRQQQQQHISGPPPLLALQQQHHYNSGNSTTTYRAHTHQQQQQLIGVATTVAGVGAVRRNQRSETAKTTLPIGQQHFKRRAVLLEVRKVTADNMATPAENTAVVVVVGTSPTTPTMPSSSLSSLKEQPQQQQQQVIIGNSSGTSRATTTTTAAGTGPTTATAGPIAAAAAAAHGDQFLLAQTVPSTSGTVIPLVPMPSSAINSVQRQHQQEAETGPTGSSPAVLINLARGRNAAEDGRRCVTGHWWRRWGWWRHRRRNHLDGQQQQNWGRPNVAASTVAASDDQHRPVVTQSASSVFVLGGVEQHSNSCNGTKRRSTPRDGYTRKWRAHAGRNWFFCDGRFMLARQSSIFLLTLFLILFTMTLFCVYDLPYLTENVSLLIPMVSLLLFLFVMATLLKTAFSDPGIVPRASPREVLEWERQCQETDPYFNADEWAQPRTRLVNIRGQSVKLKYCFTCSIFRPPRSSHCSICDNCVLNFDHHCPWVGNCIGLRNYRHFYLFICSLSVLDAFLGVSVGIHLYLLSLEKGSFVEAVKVSPASILTGLINIVSIWSVLGLSGFHTYLIALGQTTNEDIKGTFNRKLHPQVKNPYSNGNCGKNLVATLCAPERPSLLDRRGWLPPDGEGPTIFVDAVILDMAALKQQQRLPMTTTTATTPQTTMQHCAVPSPCPPSPPRQQRRNIAGLDDANVQQHCHRVIIPQQSSSTRTNNGAVVGGNIGATTTTTTTPAQQRAPKMTAPVPSTPTTTTTMMGAAAHRICHGNNLVAPMGDNTATINRISRGSSRSDWSLSRGTKGRKSATTNGSAKLRADEASNSRRSPLSLVDEPRHRNGGDDDDDDSSSSKQHQQQQCHPLTVLRRRSGSAGEIARLEREQQQQQQRMEQNI